MTYVRKERSRGASQWAVAWRRLRRNKVAVCGGVIVSIYIFLGFFGPIFAAYPARSREPLYLGEAGQAPSLKHPFGVTVSGIDVFSDTLHATRNNLIIALTATAMSIGIGLVVGSLAGYYGGKIDMILMRVIEVFLIFPVFFVALVFLRIFIVIVEAGMGTAVVILILGIFLWARTAVLVRGEILHVREEEFVQAAVAIGASNNRIILRHLLPAVLPSIIVVASIGVAEMMIYEAAIGWLGFGDPNTVTWGLLLQEGWQYMRLYWWGEIMPGITLLFCVLGFNVLGDGLSDALNPRLRE